MNTVEVTSWKQGISWKTTLLSHTTEYDYFEDCGIGIRYLMQQKNSSQWVKTVQCVLQNITAFSLIN